jgi:hypothetical protein
MKGAYGASIGPVLKGLRSVQRCVVVAVAWSVRLARLEAQQSGDRSQLAQANERAEAAMPWRSPMRQMPTNDKASFVLILSPTDISAFRMAELMSRKAYARYRGCDPAAVRYAIRRGWVIPDPATGMIDPA